MGKSKEDADYKNCINQRNKLNSLKRRAKLKYYQDFVTNFKNDSKKLWKIINDLTGKCKNKQDCINHININGIKSFNKRVISNAFCNHFNNMGNNIAADVEHTDTNYTQFMSTKSNKSISSYGYEQLSYNIIKALKFEIAHPLQIIFNKSMTEGIVPAYFKSAHIIPLQKNGANHVLNKYRPISFLSCLSKILEKKNNT